jgi:S-adenosylmethionine:tRNA ribosyltransferase-isomerase
VLVANFDYPLPDELIAQEPLPDRASARMLVIHRSAGRLEDRIFRDFPDYLLPDDCVVVNNTRVFPARLFARRPSGPAQIEVLLTRRHVEDPAVWDALVRPGRKVGTGTRLRFSEDLEAEVIARGLYGERTLRFSGAADVDAAIDRLGHVPLPPYIHRSDAPADHDHYQTVFARRRGSIAAPTAGLHFTPEILARVPHLAEITLHVGLGTFQAVHTATVEEHRMHQEWFEIPPAAAESIRAAARIVAVGTTAVRTLEHVARSGPVRACSGETDIFIHPGFEFRVTGALLTNFHLPRSTLLILVCAFAGRDLVLEAYRHAVQERYRFYSYGDCMLIL